VHDLNQTRGGGGGGSGSGGQEDNNITSRPRSTRTRKTQYTRIGANRKTRNRVNGCSPVNGLLFDGDARSASPVPRRYRIFVYIISRASTVSVQTISVRTLIDRHIVDGGTTSFHVIILIHIK
jgi:hypothetical protein